ncbi:hypothetical protein CSB20_13015 [bacterium DOLZORAL124_64_63]|nr:MAG: hypothetical protein CSB20_13015 [bacterium DOLZORAL124_64_63]
MKNVSQQYVKTLLAAWSRNPEGLAPSTIPLPDGVDAAEVCELLLAHHLQVLADPYLPEQAKTLDFREGLASSRERTGFLLMELERILPAVTWADCRPVVLKGGALAQGHYARPDQRWFLDLDILVPRGQVDEVCRRLETLGYRHFSGNRDPLYYARHHLHRIMLGPQGSTVEVHWDLTLPSSFYDFDVPGVFNRAREIHLGRQTMQAASPVDQVLHGVYQQIADGFVDLKRVCDLVVLLKGLTEEEKLYLVKEAGRTNMGTALWLSLHMVKQIAGLQVPWPEVEELAPGWWTTRTLRGLDVEEGLFQRRAATVDGYSSLLHLLMLHRPSERLWDSGRFVWPDEARLMDLGYQAKKMPGLGRRLRLSAFFFKTFLGLGGRATRALLRG